MKKHKYFSDYLNPVAVKELRQMVRGRFMPGILMGSLSIQLIMAVISLVVIRDEDMSLNMGRNFFYTLVTIMMGMGLFLAPIFVGGRLAQERTAENMDLLFVSAISPLKIISGKLLSGVVLTLLLFATFLPFFTLTYFLRGISLLAVVIVMLLVFLAILSLTQASVLMACLAIPRPAKIALSLFLIPVPILMFNLVFMMTKGLVEGRMGIGMTSREFWRNLALFSGLDLLIVGFLFVVSTALLIPPAANRALPVRLYATGAWLVSLIGVLAARPFTPPNGVMPLVWAFLMVSLILFVMLIAISERHKLGLRVRRSIPKNGWKRFAAFHLYSGAAGGVAWSILFGVLTVLAAFGLVILDNRHNDDSIRGGLATASGIMAYTLAYGLIALKIHRSYLPVGVAKILKPWLLAILLPGLLTALPIVILAIVSPDRVGSDIFSSALMLPSPLSLVEEQNHIFILFFSAALALFGLLLNGAWMWRAIRDFTPPAVAVPMVMEAEQE